MKKREIESFLHFNVTGLFVTLFEKIDLRGLMNYESSESSDWTVQSTVPVNEPNSEHQQKIINFYSPQTLTLFGTV